MILSTGATLSRLLGADGAGQLGLRKMSPASPERYPVIFDRFGASRLDG